MKNLIAVIIGCLLVTGCATTGANLSPMQKRQITTKQIEGAYENVYRASMTVLQDQGYVLKTTDMASGLIVANIDRETSKSSQFWQAFFVGGVYDKDTFIEITMTINKINETLQELRMNLQETRYNQFGGKTDIKQITEAKTYDELANQIRIEVKRREALGR
jgi:hypothetical protein